MSLIFVSEILADDAKFFICHENEALIANVFANNQSKCSMKINAFCHHQRSIVRFNELAMSPYWNKYLPPAQKLKKSSPYLFLYLAMLSTVGWSPTSWLPQTQTKGISGSNS